MLVCLSCCKALLAATTLCVISASNVQSEVEMLPKSLMVTPPNLDTKFGNHTEPFLPCFKSNVDDLPLDRSPFTPETM